MKRQRSRNRGGGGSSGGGGGGGKPSHNVNRAFDSNGPDGVKIRGHAQHVFEKYQQLARDAGASGDRVLAENYLQHAEHYFRVLRAVQPQRPASEIIGRDAFTSGIDIDFEDEGGGDNENDGGDGGEDVSDTRDQQRQDNNNGRGEYRSDRRPEYRQDNNQGRQDRSDNRSETRGGDQQQQRPYRDERPRDEQRARDDRPRDDQRPRDEQRPRDDRQRSYRDDRRDRYEPRGEQRAEGADPLAVIEPEATPLTRSAAEDASPSLRSQDGSLSPAPAFLQSRVEAPAAEGADAAEQPRRRRGRPPRRAVEDNQPEPAEADEG